MSSFTDFNLSNKKMKGMMYGQEWDGMNRCCKEQREMNEKKKWQIQEKLLEATFLSSGQLYLLLCSANHFRHI